jgi:hypothetical protein
MEEDLMALSLLLALFDVQDHHALQTAAAGTLSPYAERYRQLSPNQQRRVQQALYEAFYSIFEAQRIGYGVDAASQASMAVGRGLARMISEDNRSPVTTAERNNITTLKEVLQRLLNRAIDDIRD